MDVGSSTLTATGTYTQTAGTFRLAGGSVQSNNALNFQGGLIDARGTITAAIMNNALLARARRERLERYRKRFPALRLAA